MPEYLSLLELNRKIRDGYQNLFPASVWIVAEISEIRQNYNGHVYLELIQKSANGSQILARSKATIWAGNWRSIKPFFELNTGLELKAETSVLVSVSVSFHELYGHSLNIVGIDPNYTLGDQARKRKEIIDRLIREGVYEMNKELDFPALPQRIAIISSSTAAGYSDFMTHLHQNGRNFRFMTRLFQSTMQGELAVQSIMQSLETIYEQQERFDLVVVIRGGGSKAELSTFDSYELAAHVAQFPLPVLTGIGHERDESITDLVANQSFKTPTAVADFLINLFEEHARYLIELRQTTIHSIQSILSEKRIKLQRLSDRFVPTVRRIVAARHQSLSFYQSKLETASKHSIKNQANLLIRQQSRLHNQVKFFHTIQNMQLRKFSEKLKQSAERFLSPKKQEIKHFEQHLELVKPENILRKGYTLIYQNGKIVKRAAAIQEGQLLETRFIDGKVQSIASQIQLQSDQV